jgi:hypothetical protein
VAWGYTTAEALRRRNPAVMFETMDEVAERLALHS